MRCYTDSKHVCGTWMKSTYKSYQEKGVTQIFVFQQNKQLLNSLRNKNRYDFIKLYLNLSFSESYISLSLYIFIVWHFIVTSYIFIARQY